MTGPFAIDRLRERPAPAEPVEAVKPVKPECPHPHWLSTDDGHGFNSGWQCTECGHWQWIAPWVLNRRSEID